MPLNHKKILITVSGPDRPGITSGLMKIIAESGLSIVDIGQSVTYGLLSLSIMLDGTIEKDNQFPILKDLLFEAKNMGLTLDFKAIDEQEDNKLKVIPDKFILSCVSPGKICPAFLHDVADILAKNKINIARIDSTTPGILKSLDISTTVLEKANWKKIKEKLLIISNRHRIDMAFLKDNVFRRNKRLIVFDMDSTLIQKEVIDELAHACGQEEWVKKTTKQAMEGKINFDESLKKRVARLKGLSVNKMQDILKNLPLTQVRKPL